MHVLWNTVKFTQPQHTCIDQGPGVFVMWTAPIHSPQLPVSHCKKSVSGLHAHPRESPTMLKVKEKHWVSSCLLSECYIARSDYAAQHSARRNCVQLAKNLPKLHQGCRRPQKSNCETPQGPSDWRSESAARPRNTLVHLPS